MGFQEILSIHTYLINLILKNSELILLIYLKHKYTILKEIKLHFAYQRNEAKIVEL